MNNSIDDPQWPHYLTFDICNALSIPEDDVELDMDESYRLLIMCIGM